MLPKDDAELSAITNVLLNIARKNALKPRFLFDWVSRGREFKSRHSDQKEARYLAKCCQISGFLRFILSFLKVGQRRVKNGAITNLLHMAYRASVIFLRSSRDTSCFAPQRLQHRLPSGIFSRHFRQNMNVHTSIYNEAARLFPGGCFYF